MGLSARDIYVNTIVCESVSHEGKGTSLLTK